MIFVVAGFLGSPATALTKQRPPVTETAVTQRQSDQDRLGAAAADTDQHEFGACQFANLLQIALGVHWQVAEGSGFAGGLFPSGHLDIGRLRPAQCGGAGWRVLEAFPVEAVRNTDFHALQRIETIQVRYGQFVDSVERRSISGRNGIEPAAAPGPAGHDGTYYKDLRACLKSLMPG